MKYCKKCLQTNTRPGITFSSAGICPACEYFSKLQEVNWLERKQILLDIADKYRNPAAQYDCIIGVSGGKDSTRQALWVRDYLKLRPLLVCVSYPPHQITDVGVNNLSSLIEIGFDLIQLCPAPETWRSLMKHGFNNFVNWAKSTELALFAGPPRVAIDYKIPLIFWGENPGLQLGDLNTLGKNGYDGNNLRNMNTLKGGDLRWILKQGFKKRDLVTYNYPSSKEFIKNKLQIIYLGWFLKDWSLINNASISGLSGVKFRKDHPNNTGDLYQVTSLDDDWVTLNQMIKYYKYGFGRASDYVNEMIRLGSITREEGIDLLIKYDGACSDKYILDFCSFINISVKKFWKKIKHVTNKKLFDIQNNGKIIKKFKVGVGLQN